MLHGWQVHPRRLAAAEGRRATQRRWDDALRLRRRGLPPAPPVHGLPVLARSVPPTGAIFVLN